MTHEALHDLVAGLAIDVLCATTPGEFQQAAANLRSAADQVERYMAQRNEPAHP